ncbi:MAG: hypothetical protein IKH45_08695 [Neisseriaceae bacterium]|nr:hypothetical protein [Neisseriaceae bacterium]
MCNLPKNDFRLPENIFEIRRYIDLRHPNILATPKYSEIATPCYRTARNDDKGCLKNCSQCC